MITELLDVRETASALNISVHTVRAWTFQRRLPVVRLGRKCLFRREDIEGLINRSLVQAKADEGER